MSLSIHHGVLTFACPSKDRRGAYVCIARACLARLDSKTLERCLRTGRHGASMSPPDLSWSMNALHGIAAQRVCEMIGLSRRMGILQYGVDNIAKMNLGRKFRASSVVEDDITDDIEDDEDDAFDVDDDILDADHDDDNEGHDDALLEPPVLDVSQDPPDAMHTGVVIAASDLAERSLRRVPTANVFLLAEQIGHAAGMGSVGMMFIPPGRLAQEAAYWLAVWYETTTEENALQQQRDNAEEAEAAPVSACAQKPPTAKNKAFMQVF